MAGFMNIELETLRANLVCGHCGCKFTGSDSQARNTKYKKSPVYCSSICRSAAASQKGREQAVREGRQLRKGVLTGPCKTCGQMFESRIDKMFCSIDCYTKSAQFMDMVAENLRKAGGRESIERRAQAAKRGKDVLCLECGTEFYQKQSRRTRPAKKFCGTTCYRSYLAKRFDRWIASPEGLALPQCYDEFLDREELPCVVDGCDWKGKHLSLHMNQAHGVKADEFKRAAGFNLSTGVIGKSLAEALRARALVGIANMDDDARAAAFARSQDAIASLAIHYRSLEGREHAKKSRAMLGPGPKRACAGCGALFQQSTPMGRALYCSFACRDSTYAAQRRDAAKRRIRRPDGTFGWESPST